MERTFIWATNEAQEDYYTSPSPMGQQNLGISRLVRSASKKKKKQKSFAEEVMMLCIAAVNGCPLGQHYVFLESIWFFFFLN